MKARSSNQEQPDGPAATAEAPTPGPGARKPEMVALVAERQQLAEQMERLNNEKLRRQVEDLERETAAAAERAHASQRPSDDTGTKAPAVPLARPRRRHFAAFASFLLLALAPVVVSAWYLWNRAQDRFVSYAGFSVRTEEISSAFELLGGVAELSGSSSSDTDILYKFIQSPELVARIDRQIDLRAVWTRPGTDWTNPDHDPVFAYNPDGIVTSLARTAGLPLEERMPGGAIEDLTDYWQRMVKVYSDAGTGLIDLEVQAFTPQEAQHIARLVYDESSEMINDLSAIAREDATRYAREELDQAVERLKGAREAMTRFRNQTQIVDPSASIEGQMGLLSSLQSQLAQTLIDLDILRQTTRQNDPRITQTERRVEVIEGRIAEERRKMGLGTGPAGGEAAFADLVGEYERLAVDLEFAEQSYTSALAAYDSARAEAQRQSRYLAAHVHPTLPESATRPDRWSLVSLVALFAFLAWSVLLLATYAIRDRR